MICSSRSSVHVSWPDQSPKIRGFVSISAANWVAIVSFSCLVTFSIAFHRQVFSNFNFFHRRSTADSGCWPLCSCWLVPRSEIVALDIFEKSLQNVVGCRSRKLRKINLDRGTCTLAENKNLSKIDRFSLFAAFFYPINLVDSGAFLGIDIMSRYRSILVILFISKTPVERILCMFASLPLIDSRRFLP